LTSFGRQTLIVASACVGIACDSKGFGIVEPVSLVGTWELQIEYHKPSAECHFVRPVLGIVSDEYSYVAAGFDADSLICVSTVVGTLVTTPDHTGAAGRYLDGELSIIIGVNPLITEELHICGRLIRRDSLAGGLCRDFRDYGDTIVGTWGARRLVP
jgi:hypothetical protein